MGKTCAMMERHGSMAQTCLHHHRQAALRGRQERMQHGEANKPTTRAECIHLLCCCPHVELNLLQLVRVVVRAPQLHPWQQLEQHAALRGYK